MAVAEFPPVFFSPAWDPAASSGGFFVDGHGTPFFPLPPPPPQILGGEEAFPPPHIHTPSLPRLAGAQCGGWVSAGAGARSLSPCGWNMVGEMETKEKPKPSPDYLMQLMNDKKLMSSLPNFCGIFNHLERLLDEGKNGLGERRRESKSNSLPVAVKRVGNRLSPSPTKALVLLYGSPLLFLFLSRR